MSDPIKAALLPNYAPDIPSSGDRNMADRPALNQEFGLTDAMIRAGEIALAEAGEASPAYLAEVAYLAMEAARLRPE